MSTRVMMIINHHAKTALKRKDTCNMLNVWESERMPLLWEWFIHLCDEWMKRPRWMCRGTQDGCWVKYNNERAQWNSSIFISDWTSDDTKEWSGQVQWGGRRKQFPVQ